MIERTPGNNREGGKFASLSSVQMPPTGLKRAGKTHHAF